MIPRLAGVAHAAAELAWKAAAATVGRRTRGRARPVEPEGGRTVLVVAAHPDDEAAGAAGTILLHGKAGDRVTIVHATDGAAARIEGLDPDGVAALRRAEAERAADELGAERMEWLGFRERAWDASDMEARLGDLLVAVSPGLVYAPSRVDFHPEHRAVARALAAALGRAPDLDPGVRVYQVQTPLTATLVNRFADVTAVAKPARRVLEAYASQSSSLERTWRVRRYAALAHGAGRWVEEFWEIGAAGYRRVHLADADPGAEPYRGLRHGALGDPLAYGRGRRARRRLARLTRKPTPAPAPRTSGPGRAGRRRESRRG